MPPFPQPTFQFSYNVQQEISNLRNFRDTKPGRSKPTKNNNHILIATWNIANLGLQNRKNTDYQLLAEIISWFDLVGLQEVNDNIEGLREIQNLLPLTYNIIFNDKAGNDERAAFVYDSSKISQLEMIGEVAVAPSQVRWITLPGIDRKYKGFDRNPFFVSFHAGNLEFVVANVHLFFGSHNKADVERRALEAYAVARWADLRHDDVHQYSQNFLVLGDFNLPKYEPGDEIYTALKRRGLQRPEHSTKIGSNLTGDKEYDQILFTPGPIKNQLVSSGIFDFDTGVFPKLWSDFSEDQFRAYLRYYLSDHRPLWAQFKTN